MNQSPVKPVVAGFIGTFTFIFVGVSAIHHNPDLFGVALASGHWNNHLVYWISPLLGGAVAGLIYGRFLIKESK